MNIIKNTVGIAFGCYAPMHQGHLDLIFKAKRECSEGVIIIVCGSDTDRGVAHNMPLIKRFEYIKEFFKNDELVKVCMIDETNLNIEPYPNGWDKWLSYFNVIYNNYKYGKRVWYVGEKDYVKQLEKRNEETENIKPKNQESVKTKNHQW